MIGLALPEIALLLTTALVAGVVRGFAGFGTAMVFLPVAAQIVEPFEALTILIIMDLVGPLVHVPRALRDGHPSDVLRLGIGAAIGLPIGLYVLSIVPPVVFRWTVSLVALMLLGLLIGGVRYRGRMTPPLMFGTGALGGLLGGTAGLPGPPVILLYMASTLPPSAVRANNILYLLIVDILLLGILAFRGFLALGAVTLGVAAIAPYMCGNLLGARLFRPEAERFYRAAAYAIIATSAVLGLPIWD